MKIIVLLALFVCANAASLKVITVKSLNPEDVLGHSRMVRSPTLVAPLASASSSANANANTAFGFGLVGAAAKANAQTNTSQFGSSASASSSSSAFSHHNFFPGQFRGLNEAHFDADAKANAGIDI